VFTATVVHCFKFVTHQIIILQLGQSMIGYLHLSLLRSGVGFCYWLNMVSFAETCGLSWLCLCRKISWWTSFCCRWHPTPTLVALFDQLFFCSFLAVICLTNQSALMNLPTEQFAERTICWVFNLTTACLNTTFWYITQAQLFYCFWVNDLFSAVCNLTGEGLTDRELFCLHLFYCSGAGCILRDLGKTWW